MTSEILTPPFGKLSNEEKAKLVLGCYCDGKTIQFFSKFTGMWQNIGGNGDPCWLSDCRYRLAPEPEIPDSIDWGDVAEPYNKMCRSNSDRYAWLSGDYVSESSASTHASYKRGNMKECTVRRPK